MQTPPPIPENCPYLGLHDDPSTSLAYPSIWNYCHRARPAASVNTEHQVAACLTRAHVDCPVYLAEQEQPLPSHLRGKSPAPARSVNYRRGRGIRLTFYGILLIIALLTAAWWGRGFLTAATPPTPTPSPVAVSTDTSTPTVPPTAWTNPALIVTARVNSPTPRPSATPAGTVSPLPPTATFTRTPPATRTPTLTATPFPSPTPYPTFAPGMCGHPLDSQFGSGIKLVIHRVTSGENLDRLSEKYQTNAEAIIALNYAMPVPIWAEWVIVVPIGTTDTRGIPPFEPYRTQSEKMSIADLALKLNADAASLQKYNAFSDTCTSFVEWILIPRVRR